METYNERAKKDLLKWQKKIKDKASIIDKGTKGIQNHINGILPEKYHQIMTEMIKHLVQAVLFGAEYISSSPYKKLALIEQDDYLKEKTKFYSNLAMLEGAGTGAGGILLGLIDFPLLLSIKMKFLYETAAIYGFDTNNYKERLYVLFIFQLAFSSKEKAREVFIKMENWEEYVKTLPYELDAFDWRTFQQEYRDYLDLAKLLQLIPGIGALFGAYANIKLIGKLSIAAKYAYHMRIFQS